MSKLSPVVNIIHVNSIEDYFNGNYKKDGHGCNTLSPCPSFEDVQTAMNDISEKGVEITVTFKPEIHDMYNPGTLTNIVRTLLAKYKIRIVLIGEFDKTGRYHLHGSLLTDGKTLNTLRRKLPREIGRTEIKAIKYTQSWVEYCLKFSDDERRRHKEITSEILIYRP